MEKSEFNKEEFKKQFSEGVNKVIDASKLAATKAGVALQDFSDKSVIKFEIHQFDSKMKADYTKLGKIASDRFISDAGADVRRDDSQITPIVEEIIAFKAEIEKRQKLLAQKDAEKANN